VDDRAIDAMQLPIELAGGISLLLQHVKQALEDASFLLAVEAAGDRAPGAIALGQSAPGGASAENPQHAIEKAAMVDCRPSRLRLLGWKQWLEPLPLCVDQVSSVHSTQ
jgi:hypothetical protein